VKKRGRLSGIAGVAATTAFALSLITLALSLAGYGYELAYLNEFGLSPEELQRTPLDFLLRAYISIVHALPGFHSFWTLESFYAYMGRLIGAFFDGWLILALCLLVPISVFIKCHWRESMKPALEELAYSPVVWHTRRLIVSLLPKRSSVLGLLGWTLVPGGLGLIATALYIAVGVFLTIALLILAIVPVSSMKIGQKNAIENVKAVSGCVDLKIEQAPCVRVLQNDTEIARGRLIARSGERVFLFPIGAKSSDRAYLDVSLNRAVMKVYREAK